MRTASDRDIEVGGISYPSHPCEGKTLLGQPCLNVVRDDSDQCAAGHPNQVRSHVLEAWQDIVDYYPIGSIERRIAEAHLRSIESPSIEDLSEPLADHGVQETMDATTSISPGIRKHKRFVCLFGVHHWDFDGRTSNSATCELCHKQCDYVSGYEDDYWECR
jgi:hypothetical protein